jgi:hypothetical protein
MGHLLSVLFTALRRNLVLFVAIVLILAGGNWIRAEWKSIQSIVDELPSLERAQDDVNGHRALLMRRTHQGLEALAGASVAQLDARIRTVEREIHDLQQEQAKAPSFLSAAFEGADAAVKPLAQSVTHKVEIDLLRQEREYLIALRARVHALGNRQEAANKLEQLRLAHVKAYAAYENALRQRNAIEANAGLGARIPFTRAYEQLKALEPQVKSLRAATDQAHLAFLAQAAVLKQLPSPAALAAFQPNEERLAAVMAPLRERLLHARQLAAQNTLWRGYQALRPVLPAALGVLLGWWFVPAAIRTLFYYGLAPLAARRPPIEIGGACRNAPVSTTFGQGSGEDGSRISAVSKRLTLAPGHELLIRPDYCQSLPTGAIATTKLLFDWRRCLTSIAAHLWMLKRLRTPQPAEIVVSSTADALDEVALLELAHGDAFVLQPRGLVGIMFEAGQRPKIRSHWRLGTLHAWLTLQLRYLSFEGPATLIVKGCRGVRLEQAANGRTIGQDATLGFSINASYATVRAEPFIPYLRGRQPLLQDKFTGHGAWYLYEEVPRKARPGQPNRNPLEVLVDAGLKAFGI